LAGRTPIIYILKCKYAGAFSQYRLGTLHFQTKLAAESTGFQKLHALGALPVQKSNFHAKQRKIIP
jgi:hypothetical protein